MTHTRTECEPLDLNVHESYLGWRQGKSHARLPPPRGVKRGLQFLPGRASGGDGILGLTTSHGN